MSLNVHVCCVHKIEYGACPVNGWDDIEKFLDWLRGRDDLPSFYENASGEYDYFNEIELNKEEVRALVAKTPEGKYEKILQQCLDDADPDNDIINLHIF